MLSHKQCVLFVCRHNTGRSRVRDIRNLVEEQAHWLAVDTMSVTP